MTSEEELAQLRAENASLENLLRALALTLKELLRSLPLDLQENISVRRAREITSDIISHSRRRRHRD
jgi:hypothetical protein